MSQDHPQTPAVAIPAPSGVVLDLPVPVLVVQVAPGRQFVIEGMEISPIDDLLGMLLAPWQAQDATDDECVDRLTDLQEISHRLQREVTAAIHGTAVVAILELMRRGYTVRQLAYFTGVSVQAFNKRFGSQRDLLARLRSGGIVVDAIPPIPDDPK